MKIDWKSLEFTCVKEQSPPFDPEADAWYREARNLQKMGEDRHIRTIVSLYERAIARNHYNAMHRLALLYVDGAEGFKPDERKAIELIERVIKLNVASGYYQMGVYLEQGIGVRQDRAAALTYMRKAADMGNPQAQLAVGKRLLLVSEQPERSQVLPIGIAMLECSLKQGVGESGYALGIHYERDNLGLALRFHQDAGKLGYGPSLFSLSEIFRSEQVGVFKDEPRAACYERLWRQSKEDRTKKFPDLDLICPLPPKPMP